THIEGVSTNLDLHARLLRWQPFVSGNYHTRSLEAGLDQLLAGAS
ncbi:MAG: biotin carboxylase, partial [Kiritimatiellia bacterium]